MYTYMYINLHKYIYIDICIYIFTCICIHMCIYVCVNIYIYKHIFIQYTYTYLQIHTYIFKSSSSRITQSRKMLELENLQDVGPAIFQRTSKSFNTREGGKGEGGEGEGGGEEEKQSFNCNCLVTLPPPPPRQKNHTQLQNCLAPTRWEKKYLDKLSNSLNGL